MKKNYFYILSFSFVIIFISAFFCFYIKRPADVTFAAFAHPEDDWGKQTPAMLQLLQKDLKINFLPTRPKFLSYIPKKIRKNSQWTGGKSRVFFYLDADHPEIPENLTQAFFPIKIIYSKFPGTEVPRSWIEKINTSYDLVIVPNQQQAIIYEKSGAIKPIFVLPYFLELKELLNKPLKSHEDSNIVFANFSDCYEINNQITLIRAFAKNFKNSEKAFLWLQSAFLDPYQEFKILSEIDSLGLKNVRFTKGLATKSEYIQMLQRIDCYIDLNKGNSFSAKLLECMALGIPVIMSDHPLHGLFARHILHLVPAKKEPFFYLNKNLGYCWNTDESSVADQMKHIFENYSAVLEQTKNYRDIAKQYSCEKLKNKYLNLVKPKKIILGDKNEITDEYLMTSSETLYKKYKNLK
ncbi:MAG: hypothetical protein Tsb0015_07050 [Simkaniaceae bacterium]